ncbi:MAG: hypothetical protein ACYDDU_21005 [Dermatophilaceae bacterium]
MSTLRTVLWVVERVRDLLLLFALAAFFGAALLLTSQQHAGTAPMPTVTLQVPHTPHEGVSR